MPLLGKKNKGNAAGDGLEVTDKIENDKSDINVKSKNPFTHLKKKARIMFKLRLKRKDSDEAESESVPGFDFGEESDGKGKKEKTKKPKKEKPEKPKKEKKQKEPKEKKAPKAKDAGDGGDENDDGKKVKPIVWIIIAAGAVIVGVAAFLIANSVINKPSVEEQLIKAQELFNAQKYSSAFKIYEKLLKEDETLVPAYIGYASALDKNDQTDLAIAKLKVALNLTDNNPKIQEKIDELLAPKPEVEETETAEEDAASEPESSEDAEESSESSGDAESSGDSEAPESPEAADPVPEVVTFSDPMFEQMIRLALQKEASETITGSELSQITSLKILGNTHADVASDDTHHSLTSINRLDGYTVRGISYTERGTIRNLNDLKHFTGLTKLVIAYNAVTDISGISELTSLNTVGLYCNEIADITPLSKLESLEYLYIYNNHISNLAPLAPLTKVRQLWLNENNISDISALKGLDQLTELFLNGNAVSDISAVSGMKSLSILHFDHNLVSDISAIQSLEALTDISFLENPVTDTSPAAEIKRVNQPYY